VVPRQQPPAAETTLEENDEELSEVDEELDDEPEDDNVDDSDTRLVDAIEEDVEVDTAATERKRKRKRRDDDDLEGAYLDRLAREEERDLKRQKQEKSGQSGESKEEQGESDAEGDPGSDEEAVEEEDGGEGEDTKADEEDDDAMSPPPKHETQEAADVELQKANRTVFLGNVSTTAISSKSARKTLIKHLGSFFDEVKDKEGGKHKVESIRFRSTPYASAIPKKAAFAKKEIMDATTKSTNAYAVYSSPALAREAARRLNGTVVLDRHLRVDEVAHPAKTDSRCCIFIGNLGFVDDESNIQDANEAEGREKRKKAKEPADIEEGLWRTFGKCGKVESVRVIRDSTTRVGKGIAYVQFEDENAVEAALLYDGKKFPPMLPRKLRVARAKAMKRNAKPGSGRPGAAKAGTSTGYKRKITGEEASQIGRAGRLLGRAAAAQLKRPRAPEVRAKANGLPNGIKEPEQFVFEGHRARSGSKPSLKLGGGKKKGKPTNRSAKRAAAYKAGKKAAK
jgi:nucleolar protein 12